MAVNKLPEFAKNGQKNTDGLNLTDGFPVSKKPARQWFNWLFNTLTSKVNEIIDADFIPKADIVNNLTTDDEKKPVSAKQAKVLQDTKLGKTENAATATKLQTARTIGGVSFDGSANINLPGVNTAGNQNTTGNAATATTAAACSGNAATATTAAACSGNAATATKLATARTIAISGAVTGTATSFDGSANVAITTTSLDATKLSGTVPAAILPAASTSAAGAVKLNDTLISTSTTEALTAAQGKVLKDSLDTTITSSFGVGQTWQDFTGRRSSGVTYTNNTGKPIMISVIATGRDAKVTIYVDSVLVAAQTDIYDSPDNASTGSTIVPDGATYRVISTNKYGVSMTSWAELR